MFFILFTSILAPIGWGKRPFGLNWLEIHLSAGILLLAIVLVRYFRMLSNKARGLSTTIQWLLLLANVFITTTGIVVFRQPPLTSPAKLLGGFPYSIEFPLEHRFHVVLIGLHKFLVLPLLVLIAAHFILAITRERKSGARPLLKMFWPWRSF